MIITMEYDGLIWLYYVATTDLDMIISG